MLYSDSLSRLIDMFKKMPGIGHKSAIRLAFNIVSMSKEEADEIISTIKNAKEKIHGKKNCPQKMQCIH